MISQCCLPCDRPPVKEEIHFTVTILDDLPPVDVDIKDVYPTEYVPPELRRFNYRTIHPILVIRHYSRVHHYCVLDGNSRYFYLLGQSVKRVSVYLLTDLRKKKLNQRGGGNRMSARCMELLEGEVSYKEFRQYATERSRQVKRYMKSSGLTEK